MCAQHTLFVDINKIEDRVATVFVSVVSARVLVVVARERQLNLRKINKRCAGETDACTAHTVRGYKLDRNYIYDPLA